MSSFLFKIPTLELLDLFLNYCTLKDFISIDLATTNEKDRKTLMEIFHNPFFILNEEIEYTNWLYKNKIKCIILDVDFDNNAEKFIKRYIEFNDKLKKLKLFNGLIHPCELLHPSHLNDNKFISIIESCRGLTSLTLSFCHSITNVGITAISNYKELKILDLIVCENITVKCLNKLRELLPDCKITITND